MLVTVLANQEFAALPWEDSDTLRKDSLHISNRQRKNNIFKCGIDPGKKRIKHNMSNVARKNYYMAKQHGFREGHLKNVAQGRIKCG